MLREITQKDYALLLELDAQVYPTDSPVTPEILDTWYQFHPEFGMVYEEEGNIRAMSIVIALNKSGWKKLVRGELEESDLDEQTVFNNEQDTEVGLHVYHIEKFTGENGFYEQALTDLSGIITSLRKKNSELTICGFSALCVTAQGIGLFYNKLNCQETAFLNTEHILKKQDEIRIVDSQKEDILELVSAGWEYKNRCKMLVLSPKQPSIVWRYLE